MKTLLWLIEYAVLGLAMALASLAWLALQTANGARWLRSTRETGEIPALRSGRATAPRKRNPKAFDVLGLKRSGMSGEIERLKADWRAK